MKSILVSILFLLVLSSSKNRLEFNSKPQPPIYILEMGKIDNKKIKIIHKTIKDFFDVEVIHLGVIPKIAEAEVIGMNRYDANKVLWKIERSYPNIKGKILIVSNDDISMDRKLNNTVYKNWRVLGCALINKRTCVISTNRIGNNYRLLSNVVIHELGHTFGLRHCETKNCIMRDGKGDGNTLNKPNMYMCNECTRNINLW